MYGSLLTDSDRTSIQWSIATVLASASLTDRPWLFGVAGDHIFDQISTSMTSSDSFKSLSQIKVERSLGLISAINNFVSGMLIACLVGGGTTKSAKTSDRDVFAIILCH